MAESRIVIPPCATSEVLPDQKVTMEIFDAGMRLCTSMKSREEVTNSCKAVCSFTHQRIMQLSSMALSGIFLP